MVSVRLPYLADALKLFTFLIITGQEKASICSCTLALAQVGTNHYQVQGISNTLQVIFFKLGCETQLHAQEKVEIVLRHTG